VGSNPASKPGHPDDRWMVSFSAYPRESLTAEEVAAVVRYYEEYGSFIDARLTETSGGEELLEMNAKRKMRKVF
jgi:hypothetical protein